MTKPCFLFSLFVCLPISVSAAGPDPDLLYVLQPDAVTIGELTAAEVDWLVLEPTIDGQASGDFTPAQVEQIRTGSACTKTMLAYLSIGEAEDYRSYWDSSWVDAQGNPIPGVAPAWLGPQNPDFAGNYKVRYWDPDWQALILGTLTGPNETPLDRIVDQGFDGVYLDIIDAYDFWSTPAGGNELTRADARQKMIEWVETISNYARTTRGNSGFLVFPQNAADIIRDDNDNLDALSTRYFNAISGIGIEDLYYNELTAQPPAETNYRIAQLDEYIAHSKTVLVTDYVIDANDQSAATNSVRSADFIDRCRAAGYVPYAALNDRDLNEIITFGGAGWARTQPAPGCAGACLPDVNGDGVLDSSDFTAWIAAFNAGDPSADQNGDGLIDPSDFSAWIVNFNAGCPA
ncbi:MAG TPA: hypothetical protein ENJ00_03145 [Phycisphaerales bacterium]|nr:hypothetical protein [Phycisphaerales bacterium]